MSFMNKLKVLFIRPFSVRAATVKAGTVDNWDIIAPQQKRPFVIAAGVGQNITFEQHLAENWDAEIIMLDPTPTGVKTMESRKPEENLTYLPVGLAARDGRMSFSAPVDEAEGSFSMARKGDSNIFEFECKTVRSLMESYQRTKIDLLKMDIEGFEYDVLKQILKDNVQIDQICVELHVNRTSGVNATIFDAMHIIYALYKAGYRIVYNKAMDYTFAHKSILDAGK